MKQTNDFNFDYFSEGALPCCSVWDKPWGPVFDEWNLSDEGWLDQGTPIRSPHGSVHGSETANW